MRKRREDSSVNMVFDHITIRRFIGLIAIFLPVAVIIAAWDFPGSISGSYHAPTGFPWLAYFPSPRDIFVGALFVIGAFLMSYKGHRYTVQEYEPGAIMRFLEKRFPGILNWRAQFLDREEDWISTLGGLAAWAVALFPTAREAECVQAILFSFEPATIDIYDQTSPIHLVFAAILFLTTVYFTLVAFKRRLNKKFRTRRLVRPWFADPLKRRLIIYNISGWITLLLIIVLGVLAFTLPEGVCIVRNQTYWAETIMLLLFGAAWFTASKPRGLRDQDEEA